ncbi:branched-chain amino acid ABC transporter permease [Limibacillus sp. MBR-115]|jgi:urea ABC transporter permease protein UrtC|uniref:branched-chain amino acid ABC transporter permease n=1 Tax=Limibacillus sp. MBR-115 TaxID=3156465 RepID=UPI0033946011
MPETLSKQEKSVRRSRWGGETGVAMVVFALLALLPTVFSGYVIYILPQYMLFGLLAMSLGLLWGFGGILSFGQAAFFAVGGYAMGLMMQQALPVNAAYLGIIVAVLAGGGLAAIAGYFLFSAGVRATYFVLITLALSIIAEQIAVSQSQITGGWNGLFVDRMSLTFGPLGEVSLYGDVAFYYFVLPLIVLCYLGFRWLTLSKVGKVLVGIRENEDRVIALGFNVSAYKTLVFALSGGLAGFAGALYASQANFVSPSLAGVLFSTEVVVWVAIGGRASLLGALLGGILVSSLSNYLSAITPEYWQLLLGIIFILVIAFFKSGLSGAVVQLFQFLQRRRG